MSLLSTQEAGSGDLTQLQPDETALYGKPDSVLADARSAPVNLVVGLFAQHNSVQGCVHDAIVRYAEAYTAAAAAFPEGVDCSAVC